MKTTSILLSLVFALGFGCNKSKEDKKPADDPTTAGKTTGTEPTTPPPAADAAPAAASKEIPTEQDFEEKAATEVTKDNVEAEVEKLEKEIATESAVPAAPADPAAPAPAPGGDAPK